MENHVTQTKKFGLRILPYDGRDFGYFKIHSKPKLGAEQIPDFMLYQPIILNQLSLDFCFAFAGAESEGILTGKQFDPLYIATKTFQVMGEWENYGADLRSLCKAITQYGALFAGEGPYTFGTGLSTDKDRNSLANWQNWPQELDVVASLNRIASFFGVIDYSVGDAFDCFIQAMYNNLSQKNEKRSVIFGVLWRPEWTMSPGGIIVDSGYSIPAGDGHAIEVIGQKTINGQPYVVVQNHWGQQYGDNGLYYFPRSVIDKEATTNLGAYMFSNIEKETALWYIQNGIIINQNWSIQILISAINFLKGLFQN